MVGCSEMLKGGSKKIMNVKPNLQALDFHKALWE